MPKTVSGLAAGLVLCVAVTAAAPLQVTSPDAAYAAYANGDDTAVARWVATLPPTASPYGTLPQLQADAPWNRMAVAFLLEVAAAHPHDGRAASALTRGRTIVFRREARLGDSPDDDRFEILWHQAALGITQQHLSITNQVTYLDAVWARFEEAAARGVNLETRFALTRAVTEALVCCSGIQGIPPRRSIGGTVMARPTVDTALTLFDEASKHPSLRTEALIRAGVMLFDAGRHAQALAALEQVPAGGDPALNFVRHLTHGRVFDALARPTDAAVAYQRALDAKPDAQLAAIGLAAAHLRAGNISEATRLADIARRLPPVPGRGFNEFNSGDFRFVPSWLAEIRRLRR
jgi:tetratricopeptide (TPR) repeat protein